MAPYRPSVLCVIRAADAAKGVQSPANDREISQLIAPSVRAAGTLTPVASIPVHGYNSRRASGARALGSTPKARGTPSPVGDEVRAFRNDVRLARSIHRISNQSDNNPRLTGTTASPGTTTIHQHQQDKPNDHLQ